MTTATEPTRATTGKPEDLSLPATNALDILLRDQQLTDDIIEGNGGEHYIPITDLEARAQVPSLARLQYKRRVLTRAIAPLAALFEGGITASADSRRKQHRALIGTLIAEERGIRGDKVESLLERLANADERHIAFCRDLDDKRTKYLIAKNLLVQVEEEIRDREEAERVYGKEVASGIVKGEG